MRQITDANGNVVTQTFNAANRLTGRSASLGVGVIGPNNESYTYDGLGRMTRAQSGTVVTELTFDSLSRLVYERNAGKEITYEHDDAGNATRLEFPSAFAVRQSFDALNRPVSIGQVNGTSPGAPYEEAVGYTYRGQGLIASKALGNGLTGNRGYDAARRLLDETFLTATGQKVFQESLAWTPRSLKAAQARGDLGGRGRIFAYDGAGRLLQEGKPADPLSLVANNTVTQPTAFTALADASSFTYDKAQNLLARTEKEDGVTESVSLPLDNSGRNRPASIGSVPLEWDANGNLKRKGDLRFEYDYRNRLTRVTRHNAEVATYQYDAFNRRIGKTLGSETRSTVWSGWKPVEEYRNGDLDQRRIYGLGLDEIVQFQVDIDGDGSADQSYAPVYDATGNLAVMTGNNGKPIERYEYTPYGERKIFVDNTPPAVEQVRVKGNAIWVEFSEEIAGDALAAAAPTLTNLASQQAVEVAATQPVGTGRQARRRLVLSLQGTPPAADTQVRLTIPAAALQDSFLNQAAQAYEVTFAWPGADAVVQDNEAIQLQRVAVRDGFLEIELSEEPSLATASAIQVDGAAVTWTLGDDRYTLKSTAALPAGAHTLAIGTALADLNGATLAEAFNANLSVIASGAVAVFEASDPRETPASTIGNLFGFQGLQIDPETGLIYVRNRYYDPEMGRFITTDPMGYTDGPSQYGFALNSPANYGDPLGLCVGDLDCPEPLSVYIEYQKNNWQTGTTLLKNAANTITLGQIDATEKAYQAFQATTGTLEQKLKAADAAYNNSRLNFFTLGFYGADNKLAHGVQIFKDAFGVDDQREGSRRFFDGLLEGDGEEMVGGAAQWAGGAGQTILTVTTLGQGAKTLYNKRAVNPRSTPKPKSTGSRAPEEFMNDGMSFEELRAQGFVRDADHLLLNTRQVSGRFPKNAGSGEVLVRRNPQTGSVTHYQTYDAQGFPIKRVDLVGKPHNGIPTPHVLDYEWHTNHQGQRFLREADDVRPALTHEVPTP
jgi:RHS repeat-associated protein